MSVSLSQDERQERILFHVIPVLAGVFLAASSVRQVLCSLNRDMQSYGLGCRGCIETKRTRNRYFFFAIVTCIDVRAAVVVFLSFVYRATRSAGRGFFFSQCS